MFGSKEIAELKKQVADLQNQMGDLQKRSDFQIRVLRQQIASWLEGLPPSPQSILNGLPYSEIPKEGVLDFIRGVPNILILDVRSDEGWANGYIPGAKHIPANQVLMRLQEIPDKTQPILTVCANGNTGMSVAQLLAKEGYSKLFNALGGMAGYQGELVKPEIKAQDIEKVQGVDRQLIARVLEVLDREVRPGLKRDGGDMEVLAVEGGVVKVKMTGACTGCGSLKRTVNDGIKNLLRQRIPEIEDVEDLTLNLPAVHS